MSLDLPSVSAVVIAERGDEAVAEAFTERTRKMRRKGKLQSEVPHSIILRASACLALDDPDPTISKLMGAGLSPPIS